MNFSSKIILHVFMLYIFENLVKQKKLNAFINNYSYIHWVSIDLFLQFFEKLMLYSIKIDSIMSSKWKVYNVRVKEWVELSYRNIYKLCLRS